MSYSGGERDPSWLLVTGGGRGLGRVVVEQTLAHGHHVVATVRSREAESALRASVPRELRSRLRTGVVDLRSLPDVTAFASELTDTVGDNVVTRIIHNAGTLQTPRRRTLTSDRVEETVQIHAVAPALLALILQQRSSGPTRSVFVTSRLHRGAREADVPFAAAPRRYTAGRAYRAAKLVQIAWSFAWENREGRNGHHAVAVCPGFVPVTAAATAPRLAKPFLRGVLARTPLATTPQDAAAGIIAAAEAPLDLDRPVRRYTEIGGRGAASSVLTDQFCNNAWQWVASVLALYAPTEPPTTRPTAGTPGA